MATATAEPRSLPATEGDGHKHKKNALSDGQGRLAWILLAPTLIIIAVVAGIPVILSFWESLHQTNAGVDPTTGMIAGGDKFVGLQNFTDIFTGARPGDGFLRHHGPLLERLPQHHLHHHRLRALGDCYWRGDGPDHGKGIPGTWDRSGRHLGAMGDPDDRLGADVEAHLRLIRRDEPDSRSARFSGSPIPGPRSGRSSSPMSGRPLRSSGC